MADPRTEAAAAIARAQANLADAIAELEKLPAVDTRSIALTAHALNNFLTVSGGIVNLLIPILHDHPEPQVKIWLEGLAHATNLMTHTVSQLMANSTGATPPMQTEEFGLASLAERVCAYYRISARRKGIEIASGNVSDVPTIRTDRVLVAVILDNLLSNAVKYSPRGGRIWVSVAKDGDGVACTVRDEGPGLSREEQDRLFQPGVRLGPVPSAGEPSSGYGLAVAKRFVDQLNGRIRCISAPGEGATFLVWLPRLLTPPVP